MIRLPLLLVAYPSKDNDISHQFINPSQVDSLLRIGVMQETAKPQRVEWMHLVRRELMLLLGGIFESSNSMPHGMF